MTTTAATPRRGRRADLTRGYRLEVAARILAAIAGGFVLASAMALLIAAILIRTGAQPRGPAIGTGTLLSWIIWTCGAMWAFHAPTLLRAWGGLLIPAALLGGLAFTLGLEV